MSITGGCWRRRNRRARVACFLVRRLHAVLALLALAFVALVVGANAACAPKYFQRGDVIALLVLAVGYALLLAWASLSDGDKRRAIGAASSAGLAALFLSTVSIPMLAAPLAIAGSLRLPRSATPRRLLILAIPAIVLLTFALPAAATFAMTPDQFRCP